MANSSLNKGFDGLFILFIIHENGLKALFFIWDEFSDYFENVKTAISGFQGLAQLSATVPFYFVIVTHQGQAYFPGVNKIKDRFLDPIRIDLPENMAFLLTGAALEKNSDPAVREEWEGAGGIADDRCCCGRSVHLSKRTEVDHLRALGSGRNKAGLSAAAQATDMHTVFETV